MVHRLSNKTHWIPWVYLGLILMSVTSITYLFLRQQSLLHDNRKLIVQDRQLTLRVAQESKDRDRAIQLSRTHSCRVTYGSFNYVFHTLIPHPTSSQRAGLRRLRKITRQLADDRCPIQTNPKHVPKSS